MLNQSFQSPQETPQSFSEHLLTPAKNPETTVEHEEFVDFLTQHPELRETEQIGESIIRAYEQNRSVRQGLEVSESAAYSTDAVIKAAEAIVNNARARAIEQEMQNV